MEQKIIFLKGLPASGKSTWAKQHCINNPNFKRLNKDDIREFLGNPTYSFDFEKLVLNVQRDVGDYYLSRGFSLVVDDTNFSKKHHTYWLQKASKHNLEFEQKYFDTSVEECIQRDKDREKTVGKDAILNMAKTYLNYKMSNIVVKKFYADWCRPCKTLVPIIEELKTNYPDVLFESINIEENNDLITIYGIKSVPCVIIEKDGKVINEIIGLQPKKFYENELKIANEEENN